MYTLLKGLNSVIEFKNITETPIIAYYPFLSAFTVQLHQLSIRRIPHYITDYDIF